MRDRAHHTFLPKMVPARLRWSRHLPNVVPGDNGKLDAAVASKPNGVFKKLC